jgi:deoxycytidine triphosphate deaminase
MVLTDAEIERRIASAGLLSRHDRRNVRNCAYVLRAGKVFLPESGDEQVIQEPQAGRRRTLWSIGPSEVLVVRTTERVKMPPDLCATYAPLYRLSRQGVMLLNASVVEPGYEGRLSCYLVNFSSQTIAIAKDSPIAKITFLRLSDPPARLVSEVLDDDAYEAGLADSARKFHRSFMDVAGIEARAAEKAAKSARGAILFGGVVIAFLLFWAQLEPLFSTWFRKAPGWPTNAVERAVDERVKHELAARAKELEAARASLDVHAEIQKVKAELQELKARVGGERR